MDPNLSRCAIPHVILRQGADDVNQGSTACGLVADVSEHARTDADSLPNGWNGHALIHSDNTPNRPTTRHSSIGMRPIHQKPAFSKLNEEPQPQPAATPSRGCPTSKSNTTPQPRTVNGSCPLTGAFSTRSLAELSVISCLSITLLHSISVLRFPCTTPSSRSRG